jgi:hypothetical protein
MAATRPVEGAGTLRATVRQAMTAAAAATVKRPDEFAMIRARLHRILEEGQTMRHQISEARRSRGERTGHEFGIRLPRVPFVNEPAGPMLDPSGYYEVGGNGQLRNRFE